MATPPKMVFPLFSAPVYVNNVGDFPRPDVKQLEYATGDFRFLTTVDKRVLHRPEFESVHDVVMREVESYAREVLGVNRSIEFYVTDSLKVICLV
jgi:hypothetical protein